jgi:HlyD family secretion protein
VRRYLGAALLVAAAACGNKQNKPLVVQTAAVTRRDIIVDAQATGVVEPINIIEVKSKAGGVVLKMPVETGNLVKPGDLLVQVDPRDVQNRYDQARADLDAAEASLTVAQSSKKRSDDMFTARVITAAEHETSALSYENARSSVVRARANLDLAKQALEDATVVAPVAGTVIDKSVSVGTVIASATNSVSGGTTLLKMANLNVVRVRALFNETDIGNVRSGQPATVTVDAYTDRRFQGVVEKIEPQAVVQQNVTMFPVLVTLNNQEGLLKPGMNGEVSVLIDERDNVLAIPNDAVKNVREAAATAPLLGLNADSVQAEVRGQFGNSRGGGGGDAGGNGGARGRRGGNSGGEVDLMLQAQQGQGQQDGGIGRRRGGGFQDVPVSDADCARIDAELKKHPKQKKELDDLRAKLTAMRGRGGFGGGGSGGGGGNPEFQAINEQLRKIYTDLSIDSRTAGACRRRADGNGGQTRAGGGASQSGATQARAQGGAQGRTQLQPSAEFGGTRPRSRQVLVFVADSNHYSPRIVQLGQVNFDYSEVLSGLKEGERVVLLSTLALQAQRQQQNDRARQNASPLGGAGGRGGGPRGGGR